ncbi:LmbU family transcriptional regulator [Microbispora sp. CA-102843]|uniref:LmbU family transcriptional regulator n=1 Tax=Microbispora sp. CA-102843 TaxID=3239952 RepID=UPI003D928B1F
MPRSGLELPRSLPFEEWARIGARLADMHMASAWCLGDWLVYGESAYSGRYRTALDEIALEYQTLRNYAWVARRFPVSRRRDTLSFGHHAEVAALGEAEQDFWLRKAEELGWSRNHLRSEVRSSLRERAADAMAEQQPEAADALGGQPPESVDPPGPADESDTDREPRRLELAPTSEQLEQWNAAARSAGREFEAWAVRKLHDIALRDNTG